MHVALIDDSPISRELFIRIATALDHHVVSIDETVPADLPAIVHGAAPELIVLDGRLGDPRGTDGDRIARLLVRIAALRERLPEVPIAIVAAFGEAALVRAAAGAGAGFVIARPLLRASVEATFAAVARERDRAAR